MMTSIELNKLLNSGDVWTMNYFIDDLTLDLPDRNQINNEFAEEFKARLSDMGLDAYVAESSDCDDYADEARTLMRRFHRKSRGGKSGIAFGVFQYTSRVGIDHAINFFVSNEGGARRLHFWEPQTQMEITLTKEEKNSCFGYFV